MLDESNISEQTYASNLEEFPNRLKIRFIELLRVERTAHDQLLVIYYNENKLNRLFSFEHLCRTINDIVEIPINKIITKYRKTGEWDLSDVSQNKLELIVERMLRR